MTTLFHYFMGKIRSHFTLVFAVLAASTPVRATTFTFMAQPDPPPNGPLNYSWFSGANWFTNNPLNNNALVQAGALPGASDTAVIPTQQAPNAAGNNILIDTLILDAGAGLSGGNFTVSTVEMLSVNNSGTSGASFTGSILNVSSEFVAPASSVYLNSCVVTIKLGAFMQIGSSGSPANINLSQTTIYNVGQIVIGPSSELGGGSNIVNMPNAVISGNSNAMFVGTTGTTFDNSGTVTCEGGLFQIGPFTTWVCSAGTGYYKAAFTNSILQFPSGMTVPAGATNFFSGPGTNLMLNQGSVLGTAQVGLFDTGLQAWDPGTLNFTSLNGTNGLLHVTGASGFPSVANWIDQFSSGGAVL